MNFMSSESGSSSRDIAIIGFACRYPGNVSSPGQFLEFLLNGGNGIIEVPPDRWDNKAYHDPDRSKPNRMYVDKGGFIEGIDQFDPMFFGIPPKEAAYIDPQHRWLLELTYEALENAGLRPSQLRGSNTAVYMGQFMHDYEQLLLDANAHKLITSHSATGPSMTLTSNRISYLFDLLGPSVTLDTACSSSLVALDFACKAILNGDSDVAIAGGANILLRPELTMSISAASMLSPDCLCKSFDADANGYVRSEGAGIAIIKRLELAVADGDPILAIIKATGVNQDGQTQGITVPNGSAQKALLDKTLAQAQLAPAEIHYAEAHGTGTAVGDPIEVNALGEILGQAAARPQPVIIGSVKSNIGHMEAAAGMGGLMKTVLAMRAGIIPKNMHFRTINPAIDLTQLNLIIPRDNLAWPDTRGETRKAIVNSFGFGGTNANVVLEQYRETRVWASSQAPRINHGVKLLTLSAKTERSLHQLAQSYVSLLARLDEAELHHVCYTAATRRDHFKYRLAVSADSGSAMAASLARHLETGAEPAVVAGKIRLPELQRTCFVFSGMGTQWAGAGRQLYNTEPVYRAAIDRCDAALAEYCGWSLTERMFNDDQCQVDQTDIAQPLIFATQLALFELLTTWGVRPGMIVGHSAGEVAAACCAGALSFADAIKVIHHRSRLQQTTEGTGTMLAVGLSQPAMAPYLTGLEAKVSIAAINSADSLTLAGDKATLQQLSARFDEDGVFAKLLNVGVPYHSPVMDSLREPLIAALQGIAPLEPNIRLYSTVSGQLSDEQHWHPSYWADNVRKPVLFHQAIENIERDGANIFIEVAPHIALLHSIKSTLAAKHDDIVLTGTLKRGQDAVQSLQKTLSDLYTTGAALDWNDLYPQGGKVVELPNYAWQRSRYWCEADQVMRARLYNSTHQSAFEPASHALLGGRLKSDQSLWQHRLDLNEVGFLADHRVADEIIFPGAGYIEMALAALSLTDHALIEPPAAAALVMRDVRFHQALYLAENQEKLIETSLDRAGSSFSISAQDDASGQWIKHCSGQLQARRDWVVPAPLDLDRLKTQMREQFDHHDFYAYTSSLGLSYRGGFTPVQGAWVDQLDALARIEVSDEIAADLDHYILHPAILDGAFQTFFATTDIAYLPVGIGALTVYGRPGRTVYCYFRTLEKTPSYGRGNLTITDEFGNLLVEITDFEVNAIIQDSGSPAAVDQLMYDLQWLQQPLQDSSPPPGGAWLLFAESLTETEALANALRDQGQQVRVVCNCDGAAPSNERNDNEFKGNEFNDIECNHTVAFADSQSMTELLQSMAQQPFNVIYLAGNRAGQEREAQRLFEAALSSASAFSGFAQAIGSVDWRVPPKVCVVTRTGQHVLTDEGAVDPLQGALWGFSRVLANEYPELSVRLIDVDGSGFESLLVPLCDELATTEFEEEVALRPGARFVHRLRRLTGAALEDHALRRRMISAGESFQLSRDAGSGRWSATAAAAAAAPAGAITIGVSACTPVTETDNSVASEAWLYAGEVVACGGVDTGFNCGEQVLTARLGPAASHVTVGKENVVSLPEHANHRQWLPLAAQYICARYILERQSPADCRSLLIFGVDSAFGAALADIARLQGARVIGVAQRPLTTAELDRLALDLAIINPDPADPTVIAKLQDAGIEMAVSSWTGELPGWIAKLITPLGAAVFVNAEAPPQAINQLSPAVASNSLSFAELLRYKMDFVVSVLRDLAANNGKGLATGAATDALCVAQLLNAEHPVVPTLIDMSISRIAGQRGRNLAPVRAGRTYLVTGGLGGLGLEVAQWLVNEGAEAIVLMGRRPPSAEVSKRIEGMQGDRAITIECAAADVTHLADVERVLQQVERSLPPLGGIFHCAGVLDDAVIAKQSPEKLARVLRPKVLGTWNLHLATVNRPHEVFVCFSSIAALVGWAGQSNYAFGNAFMDQFASFRQSVNLPCLSINWGPWAEAGMAASLAARDLERMSEAGMLPLQPEAGLAAMRSLMVHNVACAGVFELDWHKLSQLFANSSNKTVFGDLLINTHPQQQDNLKDLLRMGSRDIQETLLARTTADILAQVLGLESAEVIGYNDNVFDYGMNSLMSMDLKNKLQRQLEVKLPVSLVPKHPTVNAMVQFILGLEDFNASAVAEDPVVADQQLGPVPMSVAQRQQLNQIKDPHWGHICNYFETEQAFDSHLLQLALDQLVLHHDALRARFKITDGVWHCELTDYTSQPAVIELDWSHLLDPLELEDALTTACQRLAVSHRLEQDPLVQIINIKRGAAGNDLIVFCIHHLAFDGYSLPILLEDLQASYVSLASGLPLKLPKKTTAAHTWVQALVDYTNSPAVSREVDYWRRLPWPHSQRSLVDFPENLERYSGHQTARLSTHLNADLTQQLIKTVVRGRSIAMQDLLVAAYVMAEAAWKHSDRIAVRLFDNGRTAIPGAEQFDLSRTVGWLSCLSTLLIKAPRPTDDALQAADDICKQIASVPNRGLHQQLLANLHHDASIRAELEELPKPAVWINYFANPMDSLAQPVKEVPNFSWINPDNQPDWLLMLNINLRGKELWVEWHYNQTLFTDATLELVAKLYLDALTRISEMSTTTDNNAIY